MTMSDTLGQQKCHVSATICLMQLTSWHLYLPMPGMQHCVQAHNKSTDASAIHQVDKEAHFCEAVSRLRHQPSSSSQVVVLQRGDVIVGDSQLVPGLDQEVVVDSAVLVVMDGS